MEPEKQTYPPPYTTQQYPPADPGQYPPTQPQQYPAQPYPAQPYPQYPAGPAAAQPTPAPGPYPPAPAAPAGQQGTTVVLTAPTIVLGGGTPTYGYQPARTNCPHCHGDVVTNIDHEVGGMAWMICGIIVLVSVFFAPCFLLGCCFIPFCIPDCKDVVHVCPSCKQTLARVPRLK